MKKFLKWLSIAVLSAALFACPQFARAGVSEIEPGRIIMSDQVYNSDFIDFYKLTLDETVRHYHLLIHGPGGAPTATIGIINRILEMKKAGITFTTEVYAAAYSADAYIFMMGDERIIHAGATLMWHTMTAQMPYRLDLNNPKHLWVHLCDQYIRKIFKRVTGMSDKMVKLWLDTRDAAFMSALTAYNIGIATKYVEN